MSWATCLLFTGVPARCVVLRVRCPWSLGSHSPVCPLGALGCVCDVLGHLDPVHQCAHSVRCVACAVSWATWILFTGVLARCFVLRVRCLGRVGSCSPVCPLGALCCVCGVLGHMVPVHRCIRSVHCVACAMSWTPWLLSTGLPARCIVLPLRCPGPLGSCSLVCSFGALCWLCGVLGHLAPVHRCARSVRCVVCAVSWDTSTLLTGVLARCFVLRVRRPGPLSSCLPVCSLGLLYCVCCVPGHLAPAHRCSRSVRCVVCAVSSATGLLFAGVLVRCVVLHVPRPGPLGYCSPVCRLGALCCVCGVCCVSGVLVHLAPVCRCAGSVCCVACAVSWPTCLLLPGVPAWCVVLRARSPRPLGYFSPVCPLHALCCVCGVFGH